ncbi:MAG: zinc-binding dehydrogenase [Myxococcota bacterium]
MSQPTNAPKLPATMRAFRVHEFGPEPTVAMKLEEVPLPVPGPGELLVRAQGIPLNLNDLERVNGKNMMVRPELPVTPGMETMGVVAACGAGAESWLGKRVVAMPKQATGGFAEYAICPTVSAFDMPESIPFPDAAAIYYPFHLAWLGLVERAALRAGESVLIHAAAGGSGSAAVQLAKHLGARVFATAGSESKLALCRELGADVAINYEKDDFAEIVLNETQGRGVEVVFDNVGEGVMEKSMKALAYDGRYVMMGFASDKKYADEKLIVPRRVIAGNMKLCGALLAYAEAPVRAMMKKAMGWNFCPRELGVEITRQVVDLVLAGRVRPVIGQVVPFEEIPAALTRMVNRQTVGRTIARVG